MLTDFGCNKVSGGKTEKPGFCLHLLLWNQKTGECLKNIPHRCGIKSPPLLFVVPRPGEGPEFFALQPFFHKMDSDLGMQPRVHCTSISATAAK